MIKFLTFLAIFALVGCSTPHYTLDDDSRSILQIPKSLEVVKINSVGVWNLTKSSRPRYPRDAAKKGIRGWVIVGHTIDPQGIPKNLKVVASHPSNIFDGSAIKAMKRFRYIYPEEQGDPVEECREHMFTF